MDELSSPTDIGTGDVSLLVLSLGFSLSLAFLLTPATSLASAFGVSSPSSLALLTVFPSWAPVSSARAPPVKTSVKTSMKEATEDHEALPSNDMEGV